MRFTRDKIKLTFFLFFSFLSCFFPFNSCFLLYTQDIGGPSFYYGNALNHCTSGFIATSGYCRRLEYDECITIFFRICWHATKSSKHMEKAIGYMKSKKFESFSE